MFFFILCTPLSFNVCSSNLRRPGTHCCPAKNANTLQTLHNLILQWNVCGDLKANFSIAAFILFLCIAIQPLDLCRSEREFVVYVVQFSRTLKINRTFLGYASVTKKFTYHLSLY